MTSGTLTPVIFGASGYVGRLTISHLVHRKHGNRIIAYARDISRIPKSENIVVYAVRNLTKESPPRLNDNSEKIVFHFVGSSRESEGAHIRESNVDTTSNIVKWALQNRVRRLVFLSGYGVGRPSSDTYYRSKHDAEKLVQQSVTEGIEAVILRCSYIVGGADEIIVPLVEQVRKGQVCFPGNGEYRIQPILIDDLLEVFVALLDPRLCCAGVHDVLGEPISVRDFYSGILRGLSINSQIRSRPIEDYIRDAVFLPNPTLTLEQIAILIADHLGPPTHKLFGAHFRNASRVIEALVHSGTREMPLPH